MHKNKLFPTVFSSIFYDCWSVSHTGILRDIRITVPPPPAQAGKGERKPSLNVQGWMHSLPRRTGDRQGARDPVSRGSAPGGASAPSSAARQTPGHVRRSAASLASGPAPDRRPRQARVRVRPARAAGAGGGGVLFTFRISPGNPVEFFFQWGSRLGGQVSPSSWTVVRGGVEGAG